jgi:hypothetical protein
LQLCLDLWSKLAMVSVRSYYSSTWKRFSLLLGGTQGIQGQQWMPYLMLRTARVLGFKVYWCMAGLPETCLSTASSDKRVHKRHVAWHVSL